MAVIKLDGVKYKVEPPDVDGDGQTGGTEVLQSSIQQGTVPVNQPTELGESIREMFNDHVDPGTRMSSIDMKTRIYNMWERNALMAIDSLVALKFLPSSTLMITRQTKRLNVSMKGEGRKETVDVIAGKRQHDANVASGGFGNSIKGFFGMGGDKK